MSANQWGHIFKVQSFGESHGAALGVVIEGCPSGLKLDLEQIQNWMNRRRPGQNAFVTARSEADQVEILSGVYQEKTLGTPICMIVRNQDARSEDYEKIKSQARPGHADDVWKSKFSHVDHRGGGRSSGRETLSRVLAGAVAEQLAKALCPEVKVLGWSSKIGEYEISSASRQSLISKVGSGFVSDQFSLRFPDSDKTSLIEKLLSEAKEKGLSYGGQAEVYIEGLPAGIGQPVFRKLKSDLAQATLSLGASMAFELGYGINVSNAEGSEFHQSKNADAYGGIRGGLSTGEPINFKVSFKPTSSVLDVAKKGRHDPCIVPRAVPVLEAMTWLVLADHLLWRRLDKI